MSDPAPSPSSPPAGLLSTAELANVRNVDRLLPSQPLLKKMFAGAPEDYFPRLEWVLQKVLPAKSVEAAWDLELKSGVSYASLGSDIGTLHFHQLLVRLGGYRQVLELGTYIGASTLFLAQAAGPGGMVTTVERGAEFHAIARRNFVRNGFADRIRPLLGDAMATLRDLAAEGSRFDYIVLDAAKEAYAEMFGPALALLAPGGMLVIDDVLMHGDALDERPTSAKGQGAQDLLDRVAALPADHDRVVLPIGNGMLLVRKPL